MLKLDGFDGAFIGIASVWGESGKTDVMVYDGDDILTHLINEDGMSPEEAMEHMLFKIEGSYVGKHTPLIVWRCGLDQAEKDAAFGVDSE